MGYHTPALLTALASLSCLRMVYASPMYDSPLQPRKNTGSSTDPTCFYNQGGGQLCWGMANESYCQQSIDIVCNALAAQSAGNTTSVASATGYGDNSNSGNEDCVAMANAGSGNPIPVDVCEQKFQELLGCYETTNDGYNAYCVGGSINIHFDSDKSGSFVDTSQPTFSLGSPNPAGGGPTAIRPGGTSADTGGAQNVNSGAAGGSNRATGAGVMSGLLGTDEA